jgi:hypothetical protein
MLQGPSARTSQKHGPRENCTLGESWNALERSSTTVEPPTQWAYTKNYVWPLYEMFQVLGAGGSK